MQLDKKSQLMMKMIKLKSKDKLKFSMKYSKHKIKSYPILILLTRLIKPKEKKFLILQQMLFNQ